MPSRTVQELFREYLADIEHKRRHNTLLRHRGALRNLARFLDNDKPDWKSTPLTDVDVTLLERYQTARLRDGRKASSINADVRVFKTVLNFAVDHGYLSQSPIAGKKLKKLRVDKKERRYLRWDEIEQMRAALRHDQDTLDFFEVGLGTGFRKGELLNLRWNLDVDFKTNCLHVRHQGEAHQAKTDLSERTVAMRYGVREILERRFAERGSGVYVFGGDEPWSVSKISRVFRKAYKQAGISGAAIHTLRHSFGHHAIESGVGVYELKQLLGHKSLETTLRYCHTTDEHLAEAIQRIEFDRRRPRLVCETKVKARNVARASEARTILPENHPEIHTG
jgi:site-specific recombinase XerD